MLLHDVLVQKGRAGGPRDSSAGARRQGRRTEMVGLRAAVFGVLRKGGFVDGGIYGKKWEWNKNFPGDPELLYGGLISRGGVTTYLFIQAVGGLLCFSPSFMIESQIKQSF